MMIPPAKTATVELIDYIVDHVRKGDAKKQEALEHYRQAGEGLTQLKLLVGHGKFGTLRDEIRSKLRISERRVQQLMKLANEWPVDWERWQA